MARDEVQARATATHLTRPGRGHTASRCDLTVGGFLAVLDRDRDAALLWWYLALGAEQVLALGRILRQHDVAEDAGSDAVLAILERHAAALRRAPPGASMAVWTWGLLRTLVRRRFAERRQRVAASQEWALHGRPSYETCEPDEEAGPRVPGFSDEAWDRVFRPVAVAYRRCAELRLRRGLPFREIAAREGLAIATVHAHVRAATETIRDDALFT